MSFAQTCPACNGSGGRRNSCVRCGGSGWLESVPTVPPRSVSSAVLPGTVGELATALKKPASILLEQLASAGVDKNSFDDKLSDSDKKKLLLYLQRKCDLAGG
jgi:Translation initiation factor IF-2, N-terminal region